VNQGAVVLGLMVHRLRPVYIAFSAYLLLLVGLARLPASWIPEAVAGMLCMPFGFGLLATVFGFVNVEADIAGTASAYSPWLLRLPVKTSTLAFWPIAAAAVWASASWIIFAGLFLIPRGIGAPLWWPAAMVAALALNLQAILWVPVRRGGVRLVVAIAMPMAIVLFGQIASAFDWSPVHVLESYLIVALASAVAASYGLTRARTSPSSGIRTSTHAFDGADLAKVKQTRKAFQTPQAAQFWLEWRRQGRVLPLLTLFGMVGMSIPLFFSGDNDFLQGSETTKVSIWMTTALPMLPWVPLLFATAIGMGARRSDMRGSEGVYHLYHATRPLQAIDMYRAKMKAIAAGVLITAVITLSTMLIWLWLPAVTTSGKVPYVQILFGSFRLREWSIMIGVIAVLIVWTWRNQAVGAFVDYLPSRPLATAYPLVVCFIGANMFVFFTANSNQIHWFRTLPVVSIFCAVLLVAKLAVAVGCAAKLVRLRPTSWPELKNSFAIWTLAASGAATSLGLIVSVLPKEEVFPYLQHPVAEMLGVLLVPLARPIVARIALEMGRHR